jgi:HEAT repeat protein
LREGAARDLGRLTGLKDASRAVSKLVSLMADPSRDVRAGAIDSLGLIGDEKSFEALKEALRAAMASRDLLLQDRLMQALSFCGSLALADDPLAAKLPADLAGSLSAHITDGSKRKRYPDSTWEIDMLTARIESRRAAALAAISAKVGNPDKDVSEAAMNLFLALKSKEESLP